MTGFVNYGDIGDVKTDKKGTEATSALFIIASEINGHKKIPLGYVLTAGLDSDLMQKIVKKALVKMSEMQAKVLSITFDGLPANFSGFEKMGAKLDLKSIEDLKPYIQLSENSSKVFIFPDPCHMFKLLRNTFKSCGRLMDMNGKEV